MGVNSIYNIAANAMSANKLRVNTIASNIANAQTTRTEEGGPYKRRDVVFSATNVEDASFRSALDKASLKNVHVSRIAVDESEPRMVYDPSHPDANEEGVVAMPNINTVTEMVNLVSASNAYKAAAEVANITKQMMGALQRLSQRF